MRKLNKKVIREMFKNMDPLAKHKVYIAMCALLAILILAAYPTYMWFASQKGMAVIGKVNAPYTLNLASGNEESIIYLDMSSIDVGDGTGSGPTHQDYVFCVQGSWDISAYCLQLAHTTNIPFKYTIYRVSKGDIYTEAQYRELPSYLQNTSVEYITHTVNGDTPKGATIYYTYRIGATYNPNNPSAQYGKVMDENNYVNLLSGSTPNRAIKTAGDNYYDRTYEDVSVNKVQKNAMPLYMQSDILRKDSEATGGQDFFDYYVLRVDWSHVPTITNDKETDLVYITVVSSSVAGKVG